MAPVLDKTHEMLTVKYPWKPIYSCHTGCCYATLCPCIAIRDISTWHLNATIEKKYGLAGQMGSCIATACPEFSVCCCPRWVAPCYYTDLAEVVGLKLGKDMTTFGPCGEYECLGAYCSLWWPCSEPCTLCMIYGEVADAKLIGNGAHNVDAMFAKMSGATMNRH